MSRYIDYDALDYKNWHMIGKSSDFIDGVVYMAERIEEAPSIDIEPNLILPERMERGDIYEVGETIVVMNHDDYYDLLCKSWMPKRGEWRYVGNSIELMWECPQCGYKVFGFERALPNFCGNCGCDMRKEGE